MLTLLLYLVGLALGAGIGWYAHEDRVRREAQRFVDAAVARDVRTRRARQERATTWHLEAPSDAEAWDAFHQRAKIGEVRA